MRIVFGLPGCVDVLLSCVRAEGSLQCDRVVLCWCVVSEVVWLCFKARVNVALSLDMVAWIYIALYLRLCIWYVYV